MANLLKTACVQMTSGGDINANLEKAGMLIRQAAAKGAGFIATPENTCHIRPLSSLDIDLAMSGDDHIGIPFFSDIAKELGVTLLIGSMLVKSLDGKAYNCSFLFSNDGSLAATYDKIHLFDVELECGEKHCESKTIKAGDKAVIAQINDDFTLGMSICYDLRFAHLYRDMAKAGANILSVPAAFTLPTGRAHWEVLLRARAIETGCYVIAPAQFGEHDGGRNTYGNSMIIDPWGHILSQKDAGEGIIYADLDVKQVNKARAAIPALKHDRKYSL